MDKTQLIVENEALKSCNKQLTAAMENIRDTCDGNAHGIASVTLDCVPHAPLFKNIKTYVIKEDVKYFMNFKSRDSISWTANIEDARVFYDYEIANLIARGVNGVVEDIMDKL